MIIREEIRRLAEEAWNKAWSDAYAQNTFVSVPKSIESAILEGVKLALEREVSDADMAMDCKQRTHWLMQKYGIDNGDALYKEMVIACQSAYRAMTQELIKELTEEDSNAETKRSTA